MGLLAYFSSTSVTTRTGTMTETVAEVIDVKQLPPPASATAASGISASNSTSSNATSSSSIPSAQPESTVTEIQRSRLTAASTPNLTQATTTESVEPVKKRRFSFRPFSPPQNRHHEHTLTAVQEREEKVKASEALARRLATPLSTSSDKRAKESALVVRSLILGPPAAVSPKVTVAVAKPQIAKVKSQLLQPKSANKVIAQLRTLSAVGEGEQEVAKNPSGIIHAVCLEHTDEEEHELHFAKLEQQTNTPPPSTPSSFLRISTIPVEKLTSMINEMQLINLVKSPDLGLGQPGDGDGLLAGAVPTAKTVIEGIEQITPQLLALGYATGQAFTPDHTGIYPPTDRMSVLTYWWGLEVLLPSPSLVYLKVLSITPFFTPTNPLTQSAHSISNAVMNFLTALSLINNGVREILPFIRYISQFMDFEFNAITAQDRGQGVVCAATWVMPAAMVPRPWDFPSPPDSKTPDTEKKKTLERPDPATTAPIAPIPILRPLSEDVTITVTSPTPSAETIPPEKAVSGPATPPQAPNTATTVEATPDLVGVPPVSKVVVSTA